ncbi:MAG: glycosyltransferase family 2 protein [Clostridia bacterium]|nr:glycosyltransferase family 2 protein [Clostridia bacterium]
MEKIKLSIFTPTYNREDKIKDLYNSLVNQTNKNFIWLVIDDGSKDNTDKLIESYKKENKIKIEYYKKENGGKNTAIDYANNVCHTDYIFCVDSDDTLKSDAVEKIYKGIPKINNDDNYCGLLFTRDMHSNTPDYYKQIKSINDDTTVYFNEVRSFYTNPPETDIVFKLSHAKKSQFPKIPNERFITESVYYDPIFYRYKFLFSPTHLSDCTYQEDGYTSQGMNLFFKNPQGFIYACKQTALYAIKYEKSLKKKIAKSTKYYAWKKALNIKELYPEDNKIPFPFNFLGNILKIPFVKKFKKEYLEFKEKQK